MKIVIGYLFHDLLNLYGESGNVLALKKELEENNIEVEVKELSIDDEIDFKELDFIYMGSGTDNNEYIVLDFLKQYKEEIQEEIKNNKTFLITGNAVEIFGEKIITENKEEKEGLKLFNYYAEKQTKRIVAECKYKCEFLPQEIVGFANHNGIIKNVKNNLFVDFTDNTIKEGIKENNFLGTYTIGPILARNNNLLKYIANKLVESKENEVVYS